LSRQIRAGGWSEVLPRVYAITPGVTWHQRVLATSLWAGDRGTIARRSTARLHGLDGSWGDQVDVLLTSRRAAPAPWVVPIYSTIDGADRTTRKGITTVTVTRALIDLGAVVGDEDLELALESALRLGLTTCRYLEKRLVFVGGKGRRGVAALRRVLAARGTDTKATGSYLETRLIQMLRDHRIYPPERQYPVRHGVREIVRVDFAWPALKLAVEADGFRWHGTRVVWKRDLGRLSDLASVGWRALHATKTDIEDPCSFVALLRRALGEAELPFSSS
jgi:very-short-patch-repair endonuclease